jgi:alcohol dehydrogenase, propanol-preferring
MRSPVPRRTIEEVDVKALQLTGWKPEPEVREIPELEPAPGEVLVRVGGAGACHSDLHLMHDFEPGAMPWELPFTLGHENAGWVEAVGAGVHGLEIGEPVAVYGACGRCHRCRQGMENYCERQGEIGSMGGGLGRDGGMAPFMIVPSARLLVPLGDLDPAEAAPLTDAGLTPYHAIKRSLGLLVPGSTAVVVGVGGLGHMAVQMLKALSPATVIAVDQRKEALAVAADVGADQTVLAGDGAADEVRELSRGKGADVVLDVVGADSTLAFAASVARPLGHLTIVGIAGGSVSVSFFGIANEVSVATTYWGSLPELMEVVALAQEGRIQAHVQRFDFDHALDAYAALREGRLDGRAVIVPS